MLEDIVAETAGVLAWGGHLDEPDQALLYVNVAPVAPAVPELAQEFAELDRMDSSGGVGQIDAFDPSRRGVAQEFRAQLGT